MTRRTTNAAPNAIAGAASAGMTTLCASPCHRTPFSPDCTSAAPTSPPIKACDELDGKPNHHVSRFHAIAPSSAARTVCIVARFASINPFATFFATAVVTNAPARFATAAINTAIRGVSARVPTEVATAFAVSWKPFVKSKPSAIATTTTSSTSFMTRLPVLDQDRLEDVGCVLARVDGFLELLVDVLPADHDERILLRREQLGDRGAVQAVPLVFEVAQLVQLAARVLETFEPVDGVVEFFGAAKDDVRLFLRLRPDLLDAVTGDVACRLVDVVADVVDRAREVVDVVAVERRDERAVEQIDELARDTVSLVLEVLDLAQEIAVRRKLVDEATQELRDPDGVRRRVREEAEELTVLWDERDPRHEGRSLPEPSPVRHTSAEASLPMQAARRRMLESWATAFSSVNCMRTRPGATAT